MHNRANETNHIDRSRTWRRVSFSSIALFALVFTLLSLRLMAGLDPSSPGNTAATTSQPQTSATPSESADDDDESFSADSTTSPAPTTSAS